MIEQDVSFEGYRVERLIGRGGMGVVYEAVQSSLGRRVALKVLRPELAMDQAFVERFRREGRLQASVEHPHVLDVYEVGESDSNGLFLAMRLIDGPTLADLIRESELGAERALRLLGQVGAALDAAHGVGLLHRDVKPQNILVGENDHAFLADFGLSRAGGDSPTLSRPMLGTLAYVAPEVIRGEAPGPASDRYAFAATLFHCLTGDVIFPRGSDAAVLYAHTSEPLPPISRSRPDLPESLDRTFEQALAKDPADRPASALALVEEVRSAIGDRSLATLGPPRPAEDLAGASLATTAGGGGSAAGPPRDRPLVAFAAGASVAAVLAALAAAVFWPGDEEAEVPVPALASGAAALGSDLGATGAPLDCRGDDPGGMPKSCTIVQADLPGAQLLVPADGTIVGWSVRGAGGELALDVIRPRGEDTVRVARSQWESADNVASHRFPTSLPVERGDLVGVTLGPDSMIGTREVTGATTQRWISPLGGAYGSPDRGPGTGFDHELLLRADFVAGGTVEPPRQLTGAAAAGAADGLVRKRIDVEISEPPATVEVELVELDERVALDLVRQGRRESRMFVPDALPGGQPIGIKAYIYEGEEFSEVDVWWVNPDSGRMIFHFFNVSEQQLVFQG